MQNVLSRLFAVLLVLAVPSVAFAAFDGAAIATIVTGFAVGLGLIGAAILTTIYGVRVFSWARKI